MNAIAFNSAIDQLLVFIENQLGPRGFILPEKPCVQEDSGDGVSSESILISAIHYDLQMELRFFLVCGKHHNPDALFVRIKGLRDSSPVLSVSALARRWNSPLADLELNSQAKPLPEFLETYLGTLDAEWAFLIETARQELERLQLSLPSFGGAGETFDSFLS